MVSATDCLVLGLETRPYLVEMLDLTDTWVLTDSAASSSSETGLSGFGVENTAGWLVCPGLELDS